MTEGKNKEFEAFQNIHQALEPLGPEARSRVLTAVSTLLGVAAPVSGAQKTPPPQDGQSDGDDSGDEETGETYSSFAELYADSDPETNPDKALVAAYWLQICQEADSFTGHAVNAELNHLGHMLSNVTVSLSSLIKMKPQLVLQLRKSGKTKQARKTYKLSTAGIQKVKEMLNESSTVS